MRKFFIADSFIEDNEKKFEIKQEISIDEKNDLFEQFSFLNILSIVPFSYKIFLKNTNEFLAYMKSENLNALYEETNDAKEIALNANRMIYNFCASAETFIQHIHIAAKKHGNEAKEAMAKMCSDMYDNHVAYRFLTKLRNCMIHYSYPYRSMKIIYGRVDIKCKKAELLDYDSWGKAKNDLLNMDEEIDLIPYVKEKAGLLTAIFLEIHRFFLPQFLHAIEVISKLRTEYAISNPIVIETNESITPPLNLHPLPYELLKEGLEILNKHPGIKIVFKGEVN